MVSDTAVLGAQPFLRGMADEHLATLAALCRHVAVPTRQRLFEEGTRADRFWLIDAGQVTIDTTVPGRGRLIITTLGRGDVMGVAWLLPPTYVFESLRQLLSQHVFRIDLMAEAFIVNIVLFSAAVFSFLRLLQAARRAGSLLQTGE